MATFRKKIRFELSGEFDISVDVQDKIDKVVAEVLAGHAADEDPLESKLTISFKSDAVLEAGSFADARRSREAADEIPVAFDYSISRKKYSARSVELKLSYLLGYSLKVTSFGDPGEVGSEFSHALRTVLEPAIDPVWRIWGGTRTGVFFGALVLSLILGNVFREGGWGLVLQLIGILNFVLAPRTIIELGKGISVSRSRRMLFGAWKWLSVLVVGSCIVVPIVRSKSDPILTNPGASNMYKADSK